MNPRRHPCFLVGAALWACSGRGGADAFVVRDSAGIAIGESHRAAWVAGQTPRLPSTPSLTIGLADGAPEYLLFRVGGAGRLSSGEIVVANGGTQELRWFDGAGRFLRSVGRAGDGPGEYRGMRKLLVLPGDSVLVEDGLRSRMQLYSADGELRRSWIISALGRFNTPAPLGRLPTGRFIAMTTRALSDPPGHSLLEGTLVRYEDGAVVDSIGQFEAGELFTARCGPNNSAVCAYDVPFGRQSLAVVSGAYAIAGNGAEYEIRVFHPDSGLVAIHRRAIPPTAPAADRVAQRRDSVLELFPPERRAGVAERLAAVPSPERLPAYDALVTDARGRLWVGRPGDADGDLRPWDVFDPSGRWLGTVMIPRAVRVLQIGADFLLGQVRDELDVESIVLYQFAAGT